MKPNKWRVRGNFVHRGALDKTASEILQNVRCMTRAKMDAMVQHTPSIVAVKGYSHWGDIRLKEKSRPRGKGRSCSCSRRRSSTRSHCEYTHFHSIAAGKGYSNGGDTRAQEENRLAEVGGSHSCSRKRSPTRTHSVILYMSAQSLDISVGAS